MPVITLKADEAFTREVDALAARQHVSRSALLREAFVHYKRELDQHALAQRLQQASMRLSQASRVESATLDEALDDGLADE